MTRIAVFGAGGIGGYFGGRLAEAGAEVHLIARGDHLAALRSKGLRVRSYLGDIEMHLPATDDPEEIGPCDYVLFCVKSYDTREAAENCGPLIDGDTAVVSLQNGIDNEDIIAGVLGREHVMGGVAYILATIAEPGVIEHGDTPATLFFGELDGAIRERGQRLESLFAEGKVDTRLTADIQSMTWSKYSFICALSGMTAAVRRPIGDIRTVPESREMFQSIVTEVRELAEAEGTVLPEDLLEGHLAEADGLGHDVYSSLHYDLTHGRRMELESLHGAALRLADKHVLEVPACRAVYAILRPWALANQA